MDTFDYIIGTYEDYKSIGDNGGIDNGSVYVIDNSGYYAPYHYNDNKNTWMAIDETTDDYSKLHPHPSICPHCGAPTKPHLNNCEYCDVYFD